jgi:hypothetical protein
VPPLAQKVVTNKCQVKSLNRAGDYDPQAFSDAQWAQMQALSPDGVCDLSKPGIGQQPRIPWLPYHGGAVNVVYDDTALPPVPARSGSGWTSPVSAP